MSKEFIKKEIDQIINDQNHPYPQNLALACAWILGNLKGINLKILDVKEISSLADYFIIGSATNSKQAQAMADEIISQLKRSGQKIISSEGLNNSDWVLIDIGDVLVHIFLETSRENYDIDSLWPNAQTVKIPTSYYLSSPEETTEEIEKSYF